VVPAKEFTAESLHTYVINNITECRALAKSFVEKQKIKLQVDHALAAKRSKSN